MTIPTTPAAAGPYNTDGVTTAFPFTYKSFGVAYHTVIKETAGVRTSLLYGTNFSVTLNADQNANPGGNVIISPALSGGSTIEIYSNIPEEQPTQLPTGGRFNAKAIMDALDRIVTLIKQGTAGGGSLLPNDRSLRVPVGESINELTSAASRANKYLLFDGSGNVTTGVPNTSIPGALAVDTVTTSVSSSSTGVGDNPLVTLKNLNYGVGTVASLNYQFSDGTAGASISGHSLASSAGGYLTFGTRSLTGVLAQRVRIDEVSVDVTGNLTVTNSAYVSRMVLNSETYFRALSSATSSSGTSEAATYGSISSNVGAAFNQTTGRFTAPQSGLYFVTFTAQSNSAAGSLVVGFVRMDGSATNYFPVTIGANSVGDSQSACGSGAIFVAAGSYLSVFMSVYGGYACNISDFSVTLIR